MTWVLFPLLPVFGAALLPAALRAEALLVTRVVVAGPWEAVDVGPCDTVESLLSLQERFAADRVIPAARPVILGVARAPVDFVLRVFPDVATPLVASGALLLVWT